MGYFAPNLSAVVGSVVAMQLICAAGDLSSLAKMPCDDVELLGANMNRKEMVVFVNDMIFGIPGKPSPRYGMLTSSSAFALEQRIKLSNSAKAAC
ncbi:hypothetical protein MTR67_024606 [Solanum verrucosum]|uniref:Nop domain-containing protein n=1 Tax=Solanum verrucosum TaxID=315347 RepID=A0AAF0TSU7_SOLVR|nr:hypothetical protein MTR67_024606 [Solanum verrucosum]